MSQPKPISDYHSLVLHGMTACITSIRANHQWVTAEQWKELQRIKHELLDPLTDAIAFGTQPKRGKAK